MHSHSHPLPLAAWLEVKSSPSARPRWYFGDRYELQQLPVGVLPPEPDQMHIVKDAERRAHAGDFMARLELGTLYVTVSASYIHRELFQDALDAVAASDLNFSTYEAKLRLTGPFQIRWAAAWYNAAVTYWHGNMKDACSDFLGYAEKRLDLVDAEHRDLQSFTNVVSAIRALRTLQA